MCFAVRGEEINPFEVCVPVIFERIDSDIYSLKKAAGEMQKPFIQ
jgi:hypothetical protein